MNKPMYWLINRASVAVPFYPLDGETNPDPKNQTVAKEVTPQDEAKLKKFKEQVEWAQHLIVIDQAHESNFLQLVNVCEEFLAGSPEGTTNE